MLLDIDYAPDRSGPGMRPASSEASLDRGVLRMCLAENPKTI